MKRRGGKRKIKNPLSSNRRQDSRGKKRKWLVSKKHKEVVEINPKA